MIAALCVSLLVQDQPQVELAKSFVASLNPTQKVQAVLKFDDPYRMNWRFVPAQRRGAHLKHLDQDAKANAYALLASHLSKSGLEQVETIRKLEDVLKELENNPGRDSGLYAFTFFGSPSSSGVWGWRYEGHHLSLNYTFLDGELISSSPQFLGANPAEVRQGAMKGTNALAEESNLAFALISTFSDEQLKKAVTDQNAPADILTGSKRVAAIEGSFGIKYTELKEFQQRLLQSVVRAHANVQNESDQARRMQRIENAGWQNVVFAWMGSVSADNRHYYRVQGPTFVIEFDNYQNNANHIHSVWRDFKGDFGRDVLGQHLTQHRH